MFPYQFLKTLAGCIYGSSADGFPSVREDLPYRVVPLGNFHSNDGQSLLMEDREIPHLGPRRTVVNGFKITGCVPSGPLHLFGPTSYSARCASSPITYIYAILVLEIWWSVVIWLTPYFRRTPAGQRQGATKLALSSNAPTPLLDVGILTRFPVTLLVCTCQQ